MKLTHALAGVAVLAALVSSARLLATSAAPARAIAAEISVDGAVVLRAGTSDDGRPDADAVWGYLERTLVFQPTDAFAALCVDPGADAVTLGWLRGTATLHLGAPPRMVVDVAYGGLDEPFVLKLERVPADADANVEGGWRVAAETVEARFAHRRITRREAALLQDPERMR